METRPFLRASGTTPLLWHVHVDHLNRPVRMTNAAKAVVWDAVWTPWGQPRSITGTGANNARFPGQWFQLEAGLHYNWHRHYDPSLGRYTQPDPLGFVDGPSVYGYGRASPGMRVDPDGREIERSDPDCAPDCPPGLLGALCRLRAGADIHADFADQFPSSAGYASNTTLDGTFNGRPDLIDTRGMSVYELKPTSYGSGYYYWSALAQVQRYVSTPGAGYTTGNASSLIGPGMTYYSGRTNNWVDVIPDERPNSGLLFYKCRPRPSQDRCQVK